MLFCPSSLSINAELGRRIQDTLPIEICLWLSDTDLDPREFESTERLSASSMRKPAGQVSADILAVAQRYWDSEAFAQHRLQLLNELSRVDSLDMYRDIDREPTLRTIQLKSFDKLITRGIQLAFWSETPHNPISLALYYACKFLEIPTLLFQPTTSVTPGLLPRSSVDEELVDIDTDSLTDEPGANQLIVALAQRSISDLYGGQGPRLSQSEKKRIETSSSPAHLRPGWRGISRTVAALELAANSLNEKNWRRTLDKLLRREFRLRLRNSHETLSSAPKAATFALFPLQLQPERTSSPEGLRDPFQASAILRARIFLPEDVLLLVKEHPAQVAHNRPGHTGRSGSFYKFVNCLPGVQMILSDVEGTSLIQQSTVVFTLNGSPGLEAALLGRPVVYFGHPWWGGAPGTTKWSPHLLFSDLANAATKRKTLEEWLLKFIQTKTVPGYGTPSQRRDWSLSDADNAEIEKAQLEGTLELLRREVARRFGDQH